MSYLSSPRVHFFGEYIAEPSTNNNLAKNFTGPIGRHDHGWNPDGNHQFAFTGCTVTALVDGLNVQSSGDPLIGGTVTTPGSPFAKLVDLDVEVQMASRIFGLQVVVTDTAGDSVSGTMATASFRDFFGSRLLGVYQSTLTSLTWRVSRSSWLGKLKTASPASLSIRFIVDLYTGMNKGPHRGRLAGAIAPASDPQPGLYIAGRRLVGTSGPSTLAQLDGTTLTVDVGNVLPGANGEFSETSLTVAVKSSTTDELALKTGEKHFAATILPTGWTALGVVPTTIARYELTSGIESLRLSAADAATAAAAPLGLFTSSGAAVAMEADDGLFVFPDRQAFAMNPGETEPVVLTAARFGQPAGNTTIEIVRTNDPTDPGIVLPATVTTGSAGTATVTCQASDPGTPRGAIDGQIFGFGGPWADDSDIAIPAANCAVAILVFSGFPVPARPTWADVEPIFDQYNKLYPAMKAIIDLGDRDAVKAAGSEIRARLLLPIEDPGHMPVTRDLSAEKRQTIVNWIDAGCPA